MSHEMAHRQTRANKHFVIKQGPATLVSSFPLNKQVFVSLIHLRSVVQIDAACSKLRETYSNGVHSNEKFGGLVGDLAMGVVEGSSAIVIQAEEKGKTRVYLLCHLEVFSHEKLLRKTCTFFLRFKDGAYLRIKCGSSESYQKWLTAFKRAFKLTFSRLPAPRESKHILPLLTEAPRFSFDPPSQITDKDETRYPARSSLDTTYRRAERKEKNSFKAVHFQDIAWRKAVFSSLHRTSSLVQPKIAQPQSEAQETPQVESEATLNLKLIDGEIRINMPDVVAVENHAHVVEVEEAPRDLNVEKAVYVDYTDSSSEWENDE